MHDSAATAHVSVEDVLDDLVSEIAAVGNDAHSRLESIVCRSWDLDDVLLDKLYDLDADSDAADRCRRWYEALQLVREELENAIDDLLSVRDASISLTDHRR